MSRATGDPVGNNPASNASARNLRRNYSISIYSDGSSHDNKVDYDTQRDAFLSGLGLRVIHVPEAEVKQNLAAVMDFLMQQLFSARGPSETKTETVIPEARGQRA